MCLIRGYLERTILWSQLILRAKSPGQWCGFRVGHGRTVVWTMIWFGSNQMSFRSGKVWSEITLAHSERTRCFERTSVWSVDTLVWGGLIRGYFCLVGYDQRSLPDGTLTWGSRILLNLLQMHRGETMDFLIAVAPFYRFSITIFLAVSSNQSHILQITPLNLCYIGVCGIWISWKLHGVTI